MKKGLLSLLALALTVVGCQNYDDQFAELTTLVSDLQDQVTNLPDVTSQIQKLEDTLEGLATSSALEALSSTVGDLSDDVAGVTSDVASVSGAVDSVSDEIDTLLSRVQDIEDALEGVATQAEINTITATLAEVQADLDELLAANAVVNQDITINNMATLDYVESLISTEEGDPPVIVNGKVTISINDTDFTDEADLDRVNAIAGQIATILGDGTTTEGLDFDNTTASYEIDFVKLTFVDDDVDFDGKATFAALATISGALNHNINGDIAFTALTSCGTLTITDGSAVTSVNLGSLEVDGAASTGSSDGHFTFLNAETVILGDIVTAKVSSPLATEVTVKANTTSVTVQTVAEDGQVTINGTTGEISITGTATTDVFAADIVTINGDITTNEIASLHVVGLTKTSTITSDAHAVALGALTSNASGTITLDELTGAFTAEGFEPTKTLQVSGTSVTVKTVSNSSDTDLITAPNAESLTIKALADGDSFTLDSTYLGAVETLTIKGAASAGSSAADILAFAADVTVNGHTTVETINIEDGYLNDVVIDGTSSLESLTTDGYMNAFTLNDSDDLATATIGHDHIEGADASYLTVTGNADLESLTTTALTEAGDITITDNAVLGRVNLSSIAASLPVAGSYTISITNNLLTGNYTNATAQSTTTAYVQTVIKSDDIMDLKALVTADGGVSAVTYFHEIELDAVTLGTGTATETIGTRITNDSAHVGNLTGTFLGTNTYDYVIAE